MDLTWLSTQARELHAIFEGYFYILATTLLVVGIAIEYFKIVPVAGLMPRFGELVYRTFVAAFLLHAYPEISNFLSDLTEAATNKLGCFTEFDTVMDAYGEKFKDFSVSWISIKNVLTVALSFLSYVLLYLSVFLTNAGVAFIWSLLFIFSPLLIVFYILPATSFATRTLFQSLIEVCFWKITWCVLGTLLWSSALGSLNSSDEFNFLTVICYNLILAGSLLLTPIVVHALINKGISSIATNAMGIAAGSAMLNPGVMAKSAAVKAKSKITSGAMRLPSKFSLKNASIKTPVSTKFSTGKIKTKNTKSPRFQNQVVVRGKTVRTSNAHKGQKIKISKKGNK